MKNENHFENGLNQVAAEDLQTISGGWCGNDPLFPKGPQPTDPFRSYYGGVHLPGVDAQIGANLGMRL
jgi:hypothetical protein